MPLKALPPKTYGSKRVIGFGPLKCDIVIVGEAPGQEEEQTGIPFIGSSGKLLRDMLSRVGIDSRQVYITNVFKHRPRNNNFSLLYVDKGKKERSNELEMACRQLLLEVKARKPKVVLALGNEALRALTDRKSIEKWRGSVIETDGYLVLPTYHPAFIMRSYSKRAIGELDLRKALRLSKEKNFTPPKADFILNPSFEQVLDYLQTFHKRLSFDIETIGTHVRCLGLSEGVGQAICIPFIASKAESGIKPGDTRLVFEFDPSSGSLCSFWREEEERSILKELNRVFGDEETELVAQNFPFDATRLERDFGLVSRNLWMDTMIAQHCCYSELPKKLDFLVSVYTDVSRYSDYEAQSDLSTWRYNCFDASTTFEVSLRLEQELKELQVWEFYREHAQPTMIALTRIGHRGVLVNTERRKLEDERYEKELESDLKLLQEDFGREINPDSPKQVAEFLYETLNLPVQRHPKTGKPTTDKEAIESLGRKYPQFETKLNKLTSFRSKRLILSTFLRSKLSPEGRMLTSYNATGTVTGRISSSQTLDGEGGNLQNQPRGKFRQIYIAPEGKVLIKMDLSQAESRAVAWLAKIETLIDSFSNKDFDVHKWNASLIYGVEIDKVTKDQRQQAKHCLHSANYGGSPRTAVKHAKISYQIAKHALERYKSSLPRLQEWWKEIEEELYMTRKLRHPLGRLRVFFDRLNDTTLRSAIAFKPQGLVGDLINRVITNLELKLTRDFEEVLPDGCFPILQVHDEIVIEAWEDPQTIKTCLNIMRRNAEIEIEIEGVEKPLVIPCELKIGKDWFNMEEENEWIKLQQQI